MAVYNHYKRIKLKKNFSDVEVAKIEVTRRMVEENELRFERLKKAEGE